MTEKVLTKNKNGMTMPLVCIVEYLIGIAVFVSGIMLLASAEDPNLLVVLCGNAEAQPVVNAGSLY